MRRSLGVMNKRAVVMVLVVLGCSLPGLGHADDAGATAQSDTAFCRRTRAPRVEAVQVRTREWLKRLDAMRAACAVRWVRTGAVTVQAGRVAPEVRGDVQCPKGPPGGETQESVWAALSLFLPDAPVTDEVMVAGAGGEAIDDANVRCTAVDTGDGIALRPLVNDLPALKRIMAWKAKP